MAIVGVAARRYAAALLDVAQEAGAVDGCLADLRAFAGGMEGVAELKEVLLSPAVPSDQARKVVEDIANAMKLGELASSFLALLGSRRRMGELDEVVAAFSAELEARTGRQKGELVSAGPLTSAQVEKVRQAVGRVLNREVQFTQKTDPELLGGLRVTVGDRVFDLSTRSYLDSLRTRLLENR